MDNDNYIYNAGINDIIKILKDHYTYSHIYFKDWYVNRSPGDGVWVYIPNKTREIKMSSDWRPQDWDNPYSQDPLAPDYQSCDLYCHDAYERGANDMLESLIRKELDLELLENRYIELIDTIFEETAAFINKDEKKKYLQMKSYLLRKLCEITYNIDEEQKLNNIYIDELSKEKDKEIEN